MKIFDLKREDALLIVVDVQEKLYPVIDRKENIIKNISILIRAFKELNIPIVVTEQYPKGLGKTIEDVRKYLDASIPIYEKITFTAYTDEVKRELENLNKKQIVLVGMETHICVMQTARDLIREGYEVYPVIDGLGSRTELNYKNGIKLMENFGAVGINTESILFDLLKIASNKDFKKISELIK